MAVVKPTLPTGMSSGDLADLLNQIGTVDVFNLYAGVGNFKLLVFPSDGEGAELNTCADTVGRESACKKNT